MQFSRTLNVVDAHAEGESGKVVIGGLPQIQGATMFDKRLYFEEHFDQLRRLLLFEPRGAVWHNANVIVPSNDPQADMGFIILESCEYPAMSGSNTMCVATVLLETGILPMTEPITDIVLESPAGLISVRCECSNGKVVRTTLVNQPAFVYHSDVQIEVEGVGTLTVDVSYGGMTYVVVDAAGAGFALDVSEEAELNRIGQLIKRAGAEQLSVSHPTNPLIPGITQTVFTGPLEERTSADGSHYVHSKNAVIVSPGRVDRSPCGTGTSARVASLHKKGLLKTGQLFRHESLIGSLFDAYVVDETNVGPYPAVVPSISGRSWITSFNQLVLDPSDPFQNGFVVGKPWELEA